MADVTLVALEISLEEERVHMHGWDELPFLLCKLVQKVSNHKKLKVDQKYHRSK
jgi:hypothetical protein